VTWEVNHSCWFWSSESNFFNCTDL